MPVVKRGSLPFGFSSFSKKQIFEFKAMRDFILELKSEDKMLEKEADEIIKKLDSGLIAGKEADRLYSNALDEAIKRRNK